MIEIDGLDLSDADDNPQLSIIMEYAVTDIVWGRVDVWVKVNLS